jgi:hypothetical protein
MFCHIRGSRISYDLAPKIPSEVFNSVHIHTPPEVQRHSTTEKKYRDMQTTM